jgi:hypothetical protein
MKKFVFIGMAVLGIAVLAIVNVNLSNKNSKEMDLTLQNVEALSTEGSAPGYLTCYSTLRFNKQSPSEVLWSIIDCYTCTPVDCYEYRDAGTCKKNSGSGMFV